MGLVFKADGSVPFCVHPVPYINELLDWLNAVCFNLTQDLTNGLKLRLKLRADSLNFNLSMKK